MNRILPVILSGGGGTRLWPVSLRERPKQFQRIIGNHTMLQTTALRVADPGLFDPPLVVANESHHQIVEAQLREVGLPPAALILEPMGRNTAPAIALAALAAKPGALLLVLPSDNVIADIAAFHGAINTATPLAVSGWLVTFGIHPDRPETGYGYIKRAESLAPGAFAVERFVEKPDRAAAEAYLADGHYDWNGGIFLMRAERYLEELGRLVPETLAAARAAMEISRREGSCIYPGENEFASAPAGSIDYAVMEKADRVAVVPVAMGWSDVGSWDALYNLAERDERDTVQEGDVLAIDSRGCLIRSDGPTVVTVGVSDLIVVATSEAVLILPRGQSQRVREAVEAVEAVAARDSGE